MIRPLLIPPRDPARMYHNKRLQDVSDEEWALANMIVPGTSTVRLINSNIKTCRKCRQRVL